MAVNCEFVNPRAKMGCSFTVLFHVQSPKLFSSYLTLLQSSGYLARTPRFLLLPMILPQLGTSFLITYPI